MENVDLNGLALLKKAIGEGGNYESPVKGEQLRSIDHLPQGVIGELDPLADGTNSVAVEVSSNVIPLRAVHRTR